MKTPPERRKRARTTRNTSKPGKRVKSPARALGERRRTDGHGEIPGESLISYYARH